MQRFGDRGITDRVRDGRVGHPGDRDDVTRLGFFDGYAFKPAERHQLAGAAGFNDLAIIVERVDRRVDLDGTRLDLAGQDTAEEVVAIEQGNEELEGSIDIGLWRGNVTDDGFEHRGQRAFTQAGVLVAIAIAARGIEHREIALFVGRFQRNEQIEHFVEHFLNAFIRAINLVDHHDRTQAQRQRLAGNELGLRHRAFRAVDQQNHTVDHAEDAFHFAAEIGVSGGVDDVDPGAFPFDRGALGQNGDAAFFFEVVRIHRALFDPLIVAESAGLAEQLVNQRGLAMVDVGDDRDIAQRQGGGHGTVLSSGG
jgi:hypothetical protein